MDNIISYKVSLAVFKLWASAGIIPTDSLTAIDAVILQRHGLPLTSIYRETDLREGKGIV